MNSKAENSREVKVPDSLPWSARIIDEGKASNGDLMRSWSIEPDVANVFYVNERGAEYALYLIHAANNYPALVEDRYAYAVMIGLLKDERDALVKALESILNDNRATDSLVALRECRSTAYAALEALKAGA